MKNRASQKEAILYHLIKAAAGGKDYVPVFKLMGEIWIEELGKWGFVSYECSARMSEMFKENPGAFERETITGPSGAQYYGYRLMHDWEGKIIDQKLRVFHAQVTGKIMRFD